MSKQRIVILGGGTGGTLTANRLRRLLPEREADIVVVDKDDRHVYQPGLLFVPFDLADPKDLIRPRRKQLRSGVAYENSSIERVDVDANQVCLSDGTTLDYDVLVIATGAVLVPEETEGLTGSGWMENVFTFYDLEGASALRSRMSSFDQGNVIVNVIDMPIKCPVAPLEFCFLADWYFTQRGVRDKIDLTFITPLDAAFTKPVASERLAEMLMLKRINLVTDFNTAQVEGDLGRIVSYDGRDVRFDLAVEIPLHGGASYVGRSVGLGDALNFVPTDEHTLQSKVSPNIFVIGDAADIPASKAGSVAHFEGELLVDNIRRFLTNEPLQADYDGHTNCFIESGFHKALLIDFNYDTEPLPGRYPFGIGLPLLKESRLNHIGKLMFQSFYWHSLLPGRDIPGIGAKMPHAGKVSSTTASERSVS
jgi:sulfide:quinone oxidoreductase